MSEVAAKKPAVDPDPDITVEMAVEERWAYGGVRMLTSGKLGHAWHPDGGDGPELLYPYKRGERHVVGSIYTQRVARKDERVVLFGEPRYTGDKVDEGKRQQWTLKHFAAQNLLESRQREANELRRTALDDAVAPLQEIARKCVSNAQRDALLSYVIRKLTKEW